MKSLPIAVPLIALFLTLTSPGLGETTSQSSAAPQTAAAATKRPWEWTPAERAAARRDPAGRAERVRAYLATYGSQAAVPPPADIIDGRRNPELFFVTELFESLIRTYVMMPENYPHVLRHRGTDLFDDDAAWQQFVTIVDEYADVIRRELDAAKALDQTGASAVRSQKCAAAARALRAARQAYGRGRFDQMLYRTARMTKFVGHDTNLDIAIPALVEREARCQ